MSRQRSDCDKSHLEKKRKYADGQVKRLNDDQKKGCVNLNVKSALNAPEVTFCLQN